MKINVYVSFLLLIAICGCMNEEKIEKKSFTIHTIGDSTMATKQNSARPEEGWGEEIINHIVDTSLVHHINYAVNGRSTKSFLAEERWKTVKKNIVVGDYVLIQFGHNDQKENDSTRYTNAFTTYKENLRLFIRESRELGATPILLTSIVRRNFNEYGVLIDTHGNYAEAVRQVAKEMNVKMVDAQVLTERLVLNYGPEASKKIYNYVPIGHINYLEGKSDDTHLCHFGAQKVAELIIEQLKTIDSKLNEAFK